MGRPAKCRYCQEKVTTNNAYKTEINKKSAYFCNEEHYQQYIVEEEKKQQQKEKEKELHNKFLKLFCEILGVNGITNTILWKEKADLNKVFTDDIIVSYLEENKEWITKSVSRLSGGEFGKIRYVGSILRNKLGDYKETSIIMSVADFGKVTDEHYETKFKLKPRKALLELEDECYE